MGMTARPQQEHFMGREYSLTDAQLISINTIFARLYTDRAIQGAMKVGFDKVDLEYNREDAKYWPFGIGASAGSCSTMAWYL